MRVTDLLARLLLPLVLSCSSTPTHPKPKVPTTAVQVRPSGKPSPGAADQGRIVLYVNDTPYATIEYDLAASGAYASTITVDYAGQRAVTKYSAPVDAAGRWRSINADTPLGPLEITRAGDSVLVKLKGETTKVSVAADAYLFDNFGPALLTRLLAAWDHDEQVFPVYLAGAPRTFDAKVSRVGKRAAHVGASDLELTTYQVELVGVTLLVHLDGQRFIAAEVPSQHAAYVREGYESVLAKDEAGVSPPSFAVSVDRGVKVRMRDGVELAADVYRPEPAGKYPVVLARTPYKKEMQETVGSFYARRGYVYVAQDVRGRFASGGVWEPFVNERKDGYDTVEWAAAQSWSSGKVGMVGGSYLGWVQWLAAVEKPPHLVTIIPNVTPPDAFFNIPYEYGVFFLYGAVWWADVVSQNATADVTGGLMARIGDKKWSQLLRGLPVRDLDKVVLGGENKYWRAWIDHSSNDDYWKGASYLGELAGVNIPVFHQSGWFDGDGIGTKLAYGAMARLGKARQKLVLGPWGHTDQAQRRLGDWDFGAEAVAIDLQREYLRWFDHWLKGEANGIDQEPLVRVFAMGSNRWLSGNTYPLEGTQLEKWYLASGGHANTSKGDGQLLAQVPAAGTDRYVYDPGDPTPDADFYEAPDPKPGETISAEARTAASQSYHVDVTAARQDFLVYTSAPFAADVTYAGPVSAVLYAASSARDTDWFMSLVEVDEAGKLMPLVSGKIRARFRDSMSTPKLLEPGKVYAYQLDLWQTGITVKKGHRLRVEVFSADFPMFSRNLNTGGDNLKDSKYVAASQTVHHGGKYASYVLLPRVP
jgi:uncharacterized protein